LEAAFILPQSTHITRKKSAQSPKSASVKRTPADCADNADRDAKELTQSASIKLPQIAQICTDENEKICSIPKSASVKRVPADCADNADRDAKESTQSASINITTDYTDLHR